MSVFCPKCGGIRWDDAHRCEPVFQVRRAESDHARPIYAHDHEGAAERWAELDAADSADYSIANGAEVEVVVTDTEGVAKRFKVTGEYQVVYNAEEVEEP